MQHPRNVAYFCGFLAVWTLSPPNMTLFCCNFDQRQSMIRQGEPSKLIVLSLTSIRGGSGGEGFKLLTLLALDKLLFSVFRTKEQLQIHGKHTSIHSWFSNALSMPFPSSNRHHKIADFSRFREIVTLFEIINDPRLKTDPCVTCFLFFLSSKF